MQLFLAADLSDTCVNKTPSEEWKYYLTRLGKHGFSKTNGKF